MKKIISVVFLIILVSTTYAKTYQRTFKDFLGRKVTISYPPERIISLAPNVTEMLFAIGHDKAIIGVTKHCDYPPQKVRHIKKIGDFWNPSIELITDLKPELVVTPAAGYNQPKIKKLTQLGINCFVVNPQKVDQILETMEVLAQVTGKQDIGKKKIKQLKKRVEIVDKKVEEIPLEKRKKVFFALDEENLWTAGDETFINDVIKRAGGVSIAEDKKGWYKYEDEKLVIANPDIILTGISEKRNQDDIIQRWKDRLYLRAVKNNRICLVDEDSLSRAAPRAIDVLEKLFEFMYGDK